MTCKFAWAAQCQGLTTSSRPPPSPPTPCARHTWGRQQLPVTPSPSRAPVQWSEGYGVWCCIQLGTAVPIQPAFPTCPPAVSEHPGRLQPQQGTVLASPCCMPHTGPCVTSTCAAAATHQPLPSGGGGGAGEQQHRACHMQATQPRGPPAPWVQPRWVSRCRQPQGFPATASGGRCCWCSLPCFAAAAVSTWQSSTLAGGVSKKAIDRNYGTVWGAGSPPKICAHSSVGSVDPKPYWAEDFGQDVEVSSITLYSRDAFGCKLAGMGGRAGI